MIMQYPCKFQKICYRAQMIFRIPYKGWVHNTCALSILKHEQYHSDSLDQNNVAHGVYWIPQAGYWFSCRFW
jgi:hypothetical protein